MLDVDLTFRERWEDRTPRDHRKPLRAMWWRVSHEPGAWGCCSGGCHRRRSAPMRCRYYGPIRPGTGPARSPPDGERSIARAYLKALARARALVYLEDQYLWGTLVGDVSRPSCAALPSCA